MTLRNTYSGLVLADAVIAQEKATFPGQTITGVVADPGASKFTVGQRIQWPYTPWDWEEIAQQ